MKAPVLLWGRVGRWLFGTPLFNGYVSKYKKMPCKANPAGWLLNVAGVGSSPSTNLSFGFIKGRAKIQNKLTLSMQAAIAVCPLAVLQRVSGIFANIVAMLLR